MTIELLAMICFTASILYLASCSKVSCQDTLILAFVDDLRHEMLNLYDFLFA